MAQLEMRELQEPELRFEEPLQLQEPEPKEIHS
jgi:hypothetical protein